MLYHLSVLRSVWIVAVILVGFEGGFIDGKMTTWLIGETEGLFFLGGPLDVLKNCDYERGVSRNECCLEMYV